MAADRTPSPDGKRAAVAERALEAVRSRAPEGVEVVVVEDNVDFDSVDFLVPPSSGDERKRVLEVLPDLDRLAVVQVMSAGTDWIETHLPRAGHPVQRSRRP